MNEHLHKSLRYEFGEFIPNSTPLNITSLLVKAQELAAIQSETTLSSLLRVLADVAPLWQRGSSYWNKARDYALEEIPFSPSMIEASLDVIPSLCSSLTSERRIRADFGSLEILDGFVSSRSFQGNVRAFPLGVILHVTAGNVFLGAIDSLIMGILTKNISIVKLSSKNNTIPYLFAQSLCDVDPTGVLKNSFSLISVDRQSEHPLAELKNGVNGIMAWGGLEMIKSYKKDLTPGVKLLEYGPKISFQVVTKNAWKTFGNSKIAEWIARDICMWDQAACASPQNLFIEEGIEPQGLLDAIVRECDRFPLLRGELSPDEEVEHLKERTLAEYHSLFESGSYLQGTSCLVILESAQGIRPSPLGRTLIVKSFKHVDHLVLQLTPQRSYLQSCGYLTWDEPVLESKLKNKLGALGVMRFCQLGRVMSAPLGTPHDGRLSLLELMKLIPDESCEALDSLLEDVDVKARNSPTTHDDFPNKLSSRSLRDSLTGYVFSTGGTTGQPKFACYSDVEFDAVGSMLARGFKCFGIESGTRCANLFVAGNLWSSFLAVDRALQQLNALTFPIGGSADPNQILEYLKMFQPTHVLGLPTLLVSLARLAESKNILLKIPTLLFAGEHLSVHSRDYLTQVFQTKTFGSAGYASVDAGPIGYQCKHLSYGVHHLFEDHVHLDIEDNEGVVTSLFRRSTPVVKHKTGDWLEWVQGNSSCPCGFYGKSFRLLGRLNSRLNLWGCRVFIEDFSIALADMAIHPTFIHLKIKSSQRGEDLVEVHLEGASLLNANVEEFNAKLLLRNRDLNSSLKSVDLIGKISLHETQDGLLPRITRTGKLIPVEDLRPLGKSI